MLFNSIRITEIFFSLQGESINIGLPTIFIRLTGCPLRCQYCDTTYAFKGGKRMTVNEILDNIQNYSCEYICVTGGEPLAQPTCLALLKQLCDRKYKVSLETSGALSIDNVDSRVNIVLDVKTPGSGEADHNLLSNLKLLKPSDQVKFVLCSRNDYEWACEFITQHKLNIKAQILFSPSWEQLPATDLANWIVEDQLKVRFQLQLHKILWHDARGR